MPGLRACILISRSIGMKRTTRSKSMLMSMLRHSHCRVVCSCNKILTSSNHFQADNQWKFGNSWLADDCGVFPEDPQPCEEVDEGMFADLNRSCSFLLDGAGRDKE